MGVSNITISLFLKSTRAIIINMSILFIVVNNNTHMIICNVHIGENDNDI